MVRRTLISLFLFLSIIFAYQLVAYSQQPSLKPLPSQPTTPPPTAPAPATQTATTTPPAASPPAASPTAEVSPTPAETPTEDGKDDLLFIIDVSGSMNATLDGDAMIAWARKAIQSSVASLPDYAEVGLRAYGHRISKDKKLESCKDSELLVSIGAGNGSLISAAVDQFAPKGMTPIAYSLELAADDFAGHTDRQHNIILVSDGLETCGGDPMAAARSLIEKGFRIKIYTIGFNVDEAARKQLQSLATEFGGTYTDVRGGLKLSEELAELTKKTFLIKKKKKENRVRGGDSIQGAVPIEAGKRYMLDHHQKKGDYDYFSLNTGSGQRVSLDIFPKPYCITILGSNVKEEQKNYCHPEGFRFSLLDKNQKEIVTLKPTAVNSPSRSRSFDLSTELAGTIYLVAGSPTVAMYKDHEFMVTVKTFGDAGTEKDAGDTFATALPLEAGLYENSRLSPVDLTDIYKIDVPKGATLKVVVTVPTQESQFGKLVAEVVGSLGEIKGKTKHLVRGQSGTITTTPSQSDEALYIRVKPDSAFSSRHVSNYSIGIAITESTATAEALPPTLPVETATPTPPVQPTPPPPPPQPVKPMKPAPPASVEDPIAAARQVISGTGFTPWMGIVVAAFFICSIGFILFSLFKKKQDRGLFTKCLSWYEIAAGIVGSAVGIYLATQFGGVVKIVVLVIFLATGGLGIFAGGMLLSGRSFKPSFWWGIIQLPWVYLGLNWIGLKYNLSLLLGLPVYGYIKTADGFKAGGGFFFHYGADLDVNAFVDSAGFGFGLELGINLIALIFLGLLWLSSKREAKATHPPIKQNIESEETL